MSCHQDMYYKFFEGNMINNFDYLVRNETKEYSRSDLYCLLSNLMLNKKNAKMILKSDKFLENLQKNLSDESSEVISRFYILLGNIFHSLNKEHYELLDQM